MDIYYLQQHQIPISKKNNVIESDFFVYVFWRDGEMNILENYRIPKHVTEKNTLDGKFQEKGPRTNIANLKM